MKGCAAVVALTQGGDIAGLIFWALELADDLLQSTEELAVFMKLACGGADEVDWGNMFVSLCGCG